MEKSKIVKVKDSKTGKVTNLTQSESGTLTRAGAVVNLTPSQKIVSSNQMKKGKDGYAMKGKDGYSMMDKGPNMAHHPMKMVHPILKHMSGK